MFLLLHKCVALLMLLTATAAACSLPWILARPKMASGVSWTTSVLQCLAAGVLLATGFTHMLPELREQIATSLPAHHHFPLAEVLVCVGMFAIYAIEELSELCAAKCRRRADDRPSPSAPMAEYEPLLRPGDPRSCYTSTSTSSSCHSEAIGGASHQHRASSLILVAALCAHGVLEGSALGLTTTSQELWLLTAAIAMHKCLLGICVSQQLLPSTSPSSSSSGSFIQRTTSLLALAAFCLASPLGGVLSAMLFTPSSNHKEPSHKPDHNSSPSLTTGSILQAMATGTILYVVLLEILPTERSRTAGTSPVRGLANWTALVTGFTAMLAVTTFLH